jgi:hypothetical protein
VCSCVDGCKGVNKETEPCFEPCECSISASEIRNQIPNFIPIDGDILGYIHAHPNGKICPFLHLQCLPFSCKYFQFWPALVCVPVFVYWVVKFKHQCCANVSFKSYMYSPFFVTVSNLFNLPETFCTLL